MGLTRVLRTAAATLSHTFYVDEAPTDSPSPVTVAITDANGAAIASGTASLAGAGTGRYTFPLSGQALLNQYTVAWSGTIAGAAVVESDTVEIVGGFFFTLAEARSSDSSLASTTKYPTSRLLDARLETEVECEEICDRAFVRRYARYVLNGSGTTDLALPQPADPEPTRPTIRSIRAVKMASAAGLTFTALTAGELARLAVLADNTLRRADSKVWTEGEQNVIVEVEHGLDALPADLRRAAFRRFRSWADVDKSGVPDRAMSYSTPEGANYRLSIPAAYRTGIPWVDGAYSRYSLRPTGSDGDAGRLVPASRSLNFDPQHGSLFHGGVR